MVSNVIHFLQTGRFCGLDEPSQSYGQISQSKAQRKLERELEKTKHFWDPNHPNYQLLRDDPRYKPICQQIELCLTNLSLSLTNSLATSKKAPELFRLIANVNPSAEEEEPRERNR